MKYFFQLVQVMNGYWTMVYVTWLILRSQGRGTTPFYGVLLETPSLYIRKQVQKKTSWSIFFKGTTKYKTNLYFFFYLVKDIDVADIFI